MGSSRPGGGAPSTESGFDTTGTGSWGGVVLHVRLLGFLLRWVIQPN